MKKFVLALLFIIFFLGLPFAQEPAVTDDEIVELPRVFEIGEYEASYNLLVSEYNTLLLGACDDNMEIAFGKWVSLLREMELFANQVDFDIVGGKFWLNIFFSSDGTIEYIAYSLKPISREINKEHLEVFLSAFSDNFQFPLHVSKPFVHFGSTAFPILTIPVSIEELGITD